MCNLLVDVDYAFNEEAFLYLSGIEVCCQQLSNSIFARRVIKISHGYCHDDCINPLLYAVIKESPDPKYREKLYLSHCPFCGEKINIRTKDKYGGIHELVIKYLGEHTIGSHRYKTRGVLLGDVLSIKKMEV